MKKLLLNSFAFITVFTVFYLIVLWGFGTFSIKHPMLAPINFKYPVNGNGHMHSRYENYKLTSNIDILFIGASTCYRHYDVRVFEENNLSVFNFGSSGQTPLQTLSLYYEIKDKLNPKLIVYDVNPYTFSADGIESELDLLANCDITSGRLQNVLELNHIWTYNAFLYSKMTEFFGPQKKDELTTKFGDTYVNKGFVETDKTVNSYNVAGKIKILGAKDIQVNAFRNLIQALKNDHQNYVLMQSPMTKMEYNTISNKSEIDSALSRFGPYYNFNELTADFNDKTDFFDLRHLTAIGAKKYSILVLNYLNLSKN